MLHKRKQLLHLPWSYCPAVRGQLKYLYTLKRKKGGGGGFVERKKERAKIINAESEMPKKMKVRGIHEEGSSHSMFVSLQHYDAPSPW